MSNGKRCKLDADGRVIAGFKGFLGKHINECGKIDKELQPYAKPEKPMTEYLRNAPGKGKRKEVAAAMAYFQDNLQNRYVPTKLGKSGEADVHMTGKTRNKLRHNIEEGLFKAEAVPFIPEILQEKNYWQYGSNTKPRTDYDGFHYFKGKIQLPGETRQRTLKIDIGVRRDSVGGYETYSFSHDKKEPEQRSLANFHPLRLNVPAVDDNIGIFAELVNAQFDDETATDASRNLSSEDLALLQSEVTAGVIQDIKTALMQMQRRQQPAQAQDGNPALPEPVKPEQLQGPFRWLGKIKI